MDHDNHNTNDTLNENLISSILGQAELASLKSNLANLDPNLCLKDQLPIRTPLVCDNGGIDLPTTTTLLVKRSLKKRKRKSKKLIKPHERTLADIIDDKSSGKPTKAELEMIKRKQLKIEGGGSNSPLDNLPKQQYLEDSTYKSSTLGSFLFSNRKSRTKKKKKAPLKWNEQETKYFFKTLELIGLDFTLMEQFFINRTRKQLLRKFHREKKKNPILVEASLESHQRNPEQKAKKYRAFMKNYEKGELNFSEHDSSFDSLDQTIHNKLKDLLDNIHDTTEEQPIKPINFYLSKTNEKQPEEAKPENKEVKKEEDETTAENNTIPSSKKTLNDESPSISKTKKQLEVIAAQSSLLKSTLLMPQSHSSSKGSKILPFERKNPKQKKMNLFYSHQSEEG